MVNTEITVHKHIAYIEVDEYIIGWNRFYPSLLKFKKNDFNKILELIEDKSIESNFDEVFLDYLRKNHFLADENYLEKYHVESRSFIEECRKKMTDHSVDRLPFYSIQLFLEDCNINCPYCVMKHTWGKQPKREKYRTHNFEEIYNRIITLLENQYTMMEKHNQKDFVLSINGGEFLIYFDLLKKVISYVREIRNDKDSRIAINSNGVLINDEIADFLVHHNIDIYISIDGNKKHHDTTRVYFNGKGTYNDVIQSIQLLKKRNFQKESITHIQGTIQDFSKIDMDELFSMAENGFVKARLSTNLLEVESQEGQSLAVQFFEMARKSIGEKITIHDGIFDNFKNVIDKGINLKLVPFCNGLGGRANNALMYNIFDHSLSYLCQYVTSAFLHVDGDIVECAHSPELRNKALTYISKRFDSMLTKCKDCSIIGVCRGGCIMEGLTFQNELNPTACNYLQTLWFLYVNDIYEQKKAIKTNK